MTALLHPGMGLTPVAGPQPRPAGESALQTAERLGLKLPDAAEPGFTFSPDGWATRL